MTALQLNRNLYETAAELISQKFKMDGNQDSYDMAIEIAMDAMMFCDIKAQRRIIRATKERIAAILGDK